MNFHAHDFMCFSLLDQNFHSLSNSSVFFFYRMEVGPTVSYATPLSTTGLTSLTS